MIDRPERDQYLVELSIQLLQSGRLSRLEKLVASDPYLSDFAGRMRAVGRMANRLTAEGLALWLINRAITTDIRTSLRDLDAYVPVRQFPLPPDCALSGHSGRRRVGPILNLA
jgi:hypothetical protein